MEIWCDAANNGNGGWIWVEFDGNTVVGGATTPSDPNHPHHVPGDDHVFRRCTNNPELIRVVARFERAIFDFEFYKTDMELYEDDVYYIDDLDNENLIPGAVFYLYRRVRAASAIPPTHANPGRPATQTGPWVHIDTFTSATLPRGHVIFEDLEGIYEYRLREVLAPIGFATPPLTSYWMIRFCSEGQGIEWIESFNFALVFRRLWIPGAFVYERVYLDTPEFCDDLDDYIYYIYVRVYEYVWHVGNRDGKPFHFHKIDHSALSRDNWQSTVQGYLLEGAHFRLFRTSLPIELLASPLQYGADGLIIFDASGLPNAPWQEVPLVRHTSTSVLAEPIHFVITPDFAYQLIEVMPPRGFQMPKGQWRLVLDPTSVGGVRITNITDVAMPSFVYVYPPTFSFFTCRCHDFYDDGCKCVDWYLSNVHDLILPLSGGAGAMTYVASGVTLIVASMVLYMYILRKRRRFALLK